jgi:hypothetical protein
MAPEHRPDIETLVHAIAHSPIVVKRAGSRKASPYGALRPQLPDGFDDADLAVLRWIVEEAQRVSRRFARI